MERRLAAILAADVVGYSRLMGEDEAGTLAAVRDHRERIFAPSVAAHGGRIVKLMGDGVLAEFPSAQDAVAAAVEIQEADSPLVFRIGVNLGDVIVEDGDIFGEGVNIAARLEGLADPGGVCISAKVFAEVDGKLALAFEDLGPTTLKNIKDRIRVYRIALGAAPAAPRLTPPDKPSIVVLPFDNLSGDPGQAFFSDGIADDIITDLSRYGELFVIARQSAFAFHDRDEAADEFARQLGVAYVLQGGVRRAGGRARVTVQLIDVATRKTVWAERFDRDVEDIFAVQEEIAAVIVNTLVGQVFYRHYERVRTRGPGAVGAYDHALKAQQLIWAFSREATAEARKEAEAAIRLDPHFARAHALLAWTHHIQGSNGWADNPDRPFDSAFEHAKAAIAADENEPWGHCTLGFTLFWRDRDFRRGLEEARLAVRLNPSNAHFRMIVGATLAYMGKAEEALEEIEAAMRLNPLYPGLYLIHKSRALFISGRYEEALSQMERAAVAMPAHANALALLAACYAALDLTDRARKVVREIQQASPGFTLRYIRRTLPFADPADLDLFFDLLQKSGLPD